MKQFIYAFLMLFVGLTSCQDVKEPIVTNVQQQVSERTDCCESVVLTDSVYIDENDGSDPGSLAYTVGYNTGIFVERPLNWWTASPPCDTFDNKLKNCPNVVESCLNEPFNQSCPYGKTAISDWICLGKTDCLGSNCGHQVNSFYYVSTLESNCNPYTQVISQFFGIEQDSVCSVIQCLRQQSYDFLADNRQYSCNGTQKPIIEYKLIAASDQYNCENYSNGTKPVKGYHAELWIRLWCCNE